MREPNHYYQFNGAPNRSVEIEHLDEDSLASDRYQARQLYRYNTRLQCKLDFTAYNEDPGDGGRPCRT